MRVWVSRSHGVFAAVMLTCAGLPACRAEPQQELGRGELVRRGRDGTAYLDLGPRLSAVAFCVHPSGLFLTSMHHLHYSDGNGEINVVVNPGTAAQGILPAHVVRYDAVTELALLRVDQPGTYQAIPRGSARAPEELLDVFAFGYFFRREPSTPEGSYPPISVQQGTIGSLQRKDGLPQRIHLNAAPGTLNSGGPLLDREGNLLGMALVRPVASGTVLDQAIPVNVIDTFLSPPVIDFQAQKTEAIKPGEPVEFTASVLEMVPSVDPLELEVHLGGGTNGERRVTMTRSGVEYKARAVPFPESRMAEPVPIEVEFPDGTVASRTDDVPITIGGGVSKLSQLSTVRFGENGGAIAADGRRLPGVPTPPKSLVLTLGGKPLPLDTSKALGLRVPEANTTDAVSCMFVARRGQEEVARMSLPLYLDGAPRPNAEALRRERFIRPLRSRSPITYLKVESSAGEPICQGKSYFYGKDELVVARGFSHPTFVVRPEGNWAFTFSSGPRTSLREGEYRGAKAPMSDTSGLVFTGRGRRCGNPSGAFRIWEVEIKDSSIVRLAIDFVQRCEENGSPLVGMLRYNSNFH